MPARGDSALIRWHASNPLMPGMFISRSTRSKVCRLTASRASSPLPASSTEKPLATRDVRSAFLREASSSTTRTLVRCADMVRLRLRTWYLQAKGHGAAVSFFGHKMQASAVRQGDLSSDVQAQPGSRSVALGLHSAIEPFEDEAPFRRGYRAAAV